MSLIFRLISSTKSPLSAAAWIVSYFVSYFVHRHNKIPSPTTNNIPKIVLL
jgi:hypothetical protein